MLFGCLRTFSKSTNLKNFWNIIGVSNGLDSDQTRQLVRLDPGPNCLQRLSADETRRQRANGQTNIDFTEEQNISKILDRS